MWCSFGLVVYWDGVSWEAIYGEVIEWRRTCCVSGERFKGFSLMYCDFRDKRDAGRDDMCYSRYIWKRGWPDDLTRMSFPLFTSSCMRVSLLKLDIPDTETKGMLIYSLGRLPSWSSFSKNGI